jgi:carbonic anhydrase
MTEDLDAGQAALQWLQEGNRRFLAAIAAAPDPAATTATLSVGLPYAVILACADSRVAPEVVFNESLGRLFVIRVAGNVAGPLEMGSIEMAVQLWDCPLVVVMGHTRCAAVAAALGIGEERSGSGGYVPSMNVSSVLSAVRSNVGWNLATTSPDAWEEAVRANASRTRDSILKWSPGLRQRVGDGRLLVVGAIYHVETGELEVLD